ncbi:hypothetical protein Ciccas_005814 [Cichlidogyrus casuarinus]|uniref:Uncharacterized protein n=1 Tax=Cichlidogyrus casuarinus TaxID=1844966 RepID=A0ABD2Q7L5_9PLAT
MSGRADRLKKLQTECSLFRSLTDGIVVEKTLLFDYADEFGIKSCVRVNGYVFVYQFEGKIDYFFTHYSSNQQAIVLNDLNDYALTSNPIRDYMNSCIERVKTRDFTSFEQLKQEVLLFYALAQALISRERVTKCTEVQQFIKALAQALTKHECFAEYDAYEMICLVHWSIMAICTHDVSMKLPEEFKNMQSILDKATEGRAGILTSILVNANDVKMTPKQKNYEIVIKVMKKCFNQGFDETILYYDQLAVDKRYSKDEKHEERVPTTDILGNVLYFLYLLEEKVSYFSRETLSRLLPFFAVQVALLRVRVTGEEAKEEALKLYERGLKALEGEEFKTFDRDMKKVVEIMRTEISKMECNSTVSCINLIGAALEMRLEEERFDLNGTLASFEKKRQERMLEVQDDEMDELEKFKAEIMEMGDDMDKLMREDQIRDAKFHASRAELELQAQEARRNYQSLTGSLQAESQKLQAQIDALQQRNQQLEEENV